MDKLVSEGASQADHVAEALQACFLCGDLYDRHVLPIAASLPVGPRRATVEAASAALGEAYQALGRALAGGFWRDA